MTATDPTTEPSPAAPPAACWDAYLVRPVRHGRTVYRPLGQVWGTAAEAEAAARSRWAGSLGPGERVELYGKPGHRVVERLYDRPGDAG